jgi:hypothetical protein
LDLRYASKLAAYLRNPVAWDMMWASKLCNIPRKSYSLGYEVGYKDFQRTQEILR